MDHSKLKIIIKQIKLLSITTMISLPAISFCSDSNKFVGMPDMRTYIDTAIEMFQKKSTAHGTGVIEFSTDRTIRMSKALASWARVETVVPSKVKIADMATKIVEYQHEGQVKEEIKSTTESPVDPRKFGF